MRNKAGSVVLFSGGIDSTACLLYEKEVVKRPTIALTINYGQKHLKELDAAEKIANILKIPHKFVCAGKDLFFQQGLSSNDVVFGCGEESIVPCRNIIFLSIASSFAYSRGLKKIIFGGTLSDAELFPDCRPLTIRAIEKGISLSLDSQIKIISPFVTRTKSQVVKFIAKHCDNLLLYTFSCYNNNNCGLCLACVERKKALDSLPWDPDRHQMD